MAKRLWLSLLGGVILFTWGFAGHVLIRLYDPAFHGFVDEAEVTAMIERNAPVRGLYYLPLRPDYETSPTQAFVNYIPAGEASGFAAMMAIGLLVHVISVFLVLTLLAGLRRNGYWSGVARFMVAGLVIGFSVHAYYWNWFGFPGIYFALASADALVGWTLVGLVLARLQSIE